MIKHAQINIWNNNTQKLKGVYKFWVQTDYQSSAANK